jgi:diguanylate cyclase (GGDEF)-like protein
MVNVGKSVGAKMNKITKKRRSIRTPSSRAKAGHTPRRAKSASALPGSRSVKKASRPANTKGSRAEMLKTIRSLKSELARARTQIDALQASADTDFLLNILNRRGFERAFERALAYIRRYRASGAVIVLDVDGLKQINDTFGHAAGDTVLKSVTAALVKSVRSSDVVGRLGGDEFALLLWNLTLADAQAKAAAIEAVIDNLPFVFRGQTARAGASAGVALLNGVEDGVTALARADRAMYARKAARRERLAISPE